MTGWQDLLELGERELELVRAGEWDLVAEVSAARVQLREKLPTPGPRIMLVRLAALEGDLLAALRAARATTARELGALSRGRGAVRGYAGASAIGPRIDYADHRA